jgi:hypothetical protein
VLSDGVRRPRVSVRIGKVDEDHDGLHHTSWPREAGEIGGPLRNVQAWSGGEVGNGNRARNLAEPGQRPMLTALVAGTEDGIICPHVGAEGAVRTGEVVNQAVGAIGPRCQRPVLAAEAAGRRQAGRCVGSVIDDVEGKTLAQVGRLQGVLRVSGTSTARAG